MSFILPPVSAPHQPDSQPSQAAARSDEPDPNGAESFGAVLSRSLAPVGEAAGKAEGKTTTAASARRPPEGRKVEPDELINAMAMPLAPLENLLPQAMAAGHAAATPVAGTVPGAANPGLTGLLAGKTLAADVAMAGEPVTAPAQMASAEEAAPQLTPASELTPELAAASQKDKGLPALPARLQAAEAGPAVALATAGITGPSGASDSGTAGQSPQHRDRTDNLPQVSAKTTAGSGPEADTTHGSVKMPLQGMAAPDATPAGTSTSTSTSASAIGQAAVTDISAASATPPISSAGVAAVPAPAAMPASSAAPAAMARSLAPEVGSGEWGKALGQQMIHMGKGGEQVAELQLNPPGLGPLKVTLSMNDHQVQAMFVSAHSSVRAAVEAALPQLRTTLADSGISLGNTSVNSESQQQTAFAQGQSGQNGQSGQRSYRAERTPDNLVPVVQPATEASRPTGRGISVDTYA
ncbi:MAG: flagellar hook-length control protein FliK [Polaromonas sp.]|uniref:flagellar hook-length control protein FliK n=1 Tax=Polaromonas sp. TaxID=1869339 RepID=UPI002722C302|nr:flagellar hook-length control protein FliK [Polaromonas sp.]MDO9116260.1 flagellar hook-length control protein FliK [Polaromonas sp.]MDP1886219.1 flagellar hook-length control protein FliK [Polaromonas sp.]